MGFKFLLWFFVNLVLIIQPAHCEPTHAAEMTVSTATGTNDFIEYWSAAQLLLTGNNPYSPEELYALQRSLGWPDEIPLIMWNPPWVFAFTVPFAFVDYAFSQILWLIFLTAIIFFCARRLWSLYGAPDRLGRVAWLVTLTFVPVYFVLLREQIGPLILLGTVGFLHFQKRGQWVYAGAMIPLLAIKPHLVYLLWLALLFWTVDRRRWSLFLGGAGASIIAVLVPLAFNPTIFHQYLQLHLTAPPPTPVDWSTPTIGRALREFFRVEGIWLQLLPMLFGTIWFFFHWKRHRPSWNWLEQIPLLLLVSVATSFFGWVLDQVILLPALIHAATRIAHEQSPRRVRPVIFMYATISLVVIGVKFFSPYDFWYFWLSWAWLLNYLLLCTPVQRPGLMVDSRVSQS